MIPRAVLAGFLLLAPAASLRANDDISVVLTKLGRSSYSVEGSFVVQVSSRQAWTVVSDYDHLSDFVSSVKLSRVKEHHGPAFSVLEQEFVSNFWFFRRTARVLLKVQEDPYRRIGFEDLSKKDFSQYRGSWELWETPDGLLLIYRLQIESDIHAPTFIMRGVSRKMVRSLLEQVRLEILRRARLTS